MGICRRRYKLRNQSLNPSMTRFIKTIEKFKFQSGGRGKKTKANVAHFSLRAVDTLLDYLIVLVDVLFIKYIYYLSP